MMQYALWKSSLAVLVACAIVVSLNALPSDANAVSCGKKLEDHESKLIGDGNMIGCTDGEQDWECHEKYWYIPAHQACAVSTDGGKCCVTTEMLATYHVGLCGTQHPICKKGEEADPPPGIEFYYWSARLLDCKGDEPHPSCNG